MKTSNGKFFIGIGVLLTIAGVVLIPDDPIIGMIGIFFGIYNLVKGTRLVKGIQPLLIRKQQERDQRIDAELKDEIKSNTNNHKNNKVKRDHDTK